MKWLKFALRRTFLDAAFIAGLVCCVFIIAVSPFAGDSADYSPAGFVDLDRGEASKHLASSLKEMGFVKFSSRSSMEKAILSGNLDCGVVIETGLGEKLDRGDCKSSLAIIVSPATAMAETYRLAAASCLYELEAPYITFAALEGTDIVKTEVLNEYETYNARGLSFQFDVSSASLRTEIASPRTVSLTMCAVALTELILVAYSNISICRGKLYSLATVTGIKKALRISLLPQTAVRFAAVIVASSAGLLIAAMAGFDFALELIFPAVVYAALLESLSLLMGAVASKEYTAYIMIVIFAIAGLALCPVYTDAALIYPAVGTVRLLVPMYWLWLCREKTLIMLLTALGSLAASYLIFSIAAKKRRKYS